jgi:hypothetical protein
VGPLASTRNVTSRFPVPRSTTEWCQSIFAPMGRKKRFVYRVGGSHSMISNLRGGWSLSLSSPVVTPDEIAVCSCPFQGVVPDSAPSYVGP